MSHSLPPYPHLKLCVMMALLWAGVTKRMRAGSSSSQSRLQFIPGGAGHLHLSYSPALCCASNVPGGHDGENLSSLLHTTPICGTRVYPSVTSQEYWGLIALFQFVNRMELPHKKEQTEKTRDYHLFWFLLTEQGCPSGPLGRSGSTPNATHRPINKGLKHNF